MVRKYIKQDEQLTFWEKFFIYEYFDDIDMWYRMGLRTEVFYVIAIIVLLAIFAVAVV